MNNATIIIFGATGDLTKKKLLPALYNLVAHKKLNNFIIVGAAIDTVSPQHILDNARPFIENIDENIWKIICKKMFYNQINFINKNDFILLNAFVTDLEKKHNLPGNRLLYFATAAHYFCSITDHIAASQLANRTVPNEKIWYRIVYEKPFGKDLQSARDINTCIAKSFDENQIYRIDHYLTKELVSNIALLRFTNCVFEPLWNNKYIDQIQIILNETIGIEDRGSYYDHYGALADVVQNHILELLALIGMEAPEKLTGEFIRTRRAQILNKVIFIDGILGQYQSYTQEKNIKKDSQTETFAALYLAVNNPRWTGVPFYIKTGKFLNKKETVIHIKFKQVDCLLLKNCPTESNWLSIKVTPDATFSLSLNAKKPGRENILSPIVMEFCHSCVFGPEIPDAYETVFEEILYGEQSVSVRFDEIEYTWQLIDYIKSKKLPVYLYQCNSNGPQELDMFTKKHGIRWKS